MPIHFIRNDITAMNTDAIVTSVSCDLVVDGGVNGAVHRAAGPGLAEACSAVGICSTGSAFITPGFKLNCRHVIHTAPPVWADSKDVVAQLHSCYVNSLQLARSYSLESVAFPLLSSGAYGCPPRHALHIAAEAIKGYLAAHSWDADIYIVVFDTASFEAGRHMYPDIERYITDSYADEHIRLYTRRNRPLSAMIMPNAAPIPVMAGDGCISPAASLDEALSQIDESFTQMLLRKIKERGMENPDCYRKANIDKKLFSKIIKNVHYRPKKNTALALAISLELDIDETREFLMKAGYALTHSEKFDIIVEYFIIKGIYDIFEINEALFAYDMPLLGGAIL